MPGTIPNSILLYRIVHISNVQHLLTHGICTINHPNANTNYINIGDTGLITNRQHYSVKVIPPGGSLGEYIPFYFGPLSPMLLKIKDGNGGVTKRPQSEIVYVVCDLDIIIKSCPQWCFTDAHAKFEFSGFYNNLNDLNRIDWDIVKERYWRNTEEDFDRMRRKQAEFLVKYHVPINCIRGIATYDNAAKITIEGVMQNLGLNIPVKVIPNFYY